MEHAGRVDDAQQGLNDVAEAPKSGPLVAEGDMAADGEKPAEEQVYNRRAEYIPIANIQRIMRQVLPQRAKVADDAKETVQQCVTEFISYVTSEANIICNRDFRRTVMPEDIICAMRGLGFDDYVEPLTVFLHNHRAREASRHVMPHVLGGGDCSSGGEGGSSAGRGFMYFGDYAYDHK